MSDSAYFAGGTLKRQSMADRVRQYQTIETADKHFRKAVLGVCAFSHAGGHAVVSGPDESRFFSIQIQMSQSLNSAFVYFHKWI